MEKINVVYFGTQRGDFYTKEVDNTLETFQKLVGGYIETTSIVGLREKGIIIVCNEMGLLDGLAPNVNAYPFFFCGNLVFTSYDDEGDFVSLTEEQVDYIAEYFHLNNE